MDYSEKWLKSPLRPKKLPTSDKKWRLWKRSSEGCGLFSSMDLKEGIHVPFLDLSHSSIVHNSISMDNAPKDFILAWTAIRIQTAFRNLMAKRGMRMLKAVVSIQAIYRGRKVRKQVQDEREVLSSTGIEVEVEFKPVEHPIEPIDNDQPIPFPIPDHSILNVLMSKTPTTKSSSVTNTVTNKLLKYTKLLQCIDKLT